MRHISNRERIARAAEEARLAEAEKRAAKKKTSSRSKRPVTPVRMKIVWEVCDGTGRTVKSFPYPDEAAAQAQTRALTNSTGRTHTLRPTKVPLE